MPIGRGMDKDAVYINNGILLSHENAIMPCGNMDGLRDDHTKWNKLDKTMQMSYDITHVESNFFKWYKWTYLQNRTWLPDFKNKLTVPKGETWWRRMNVEFVISVHIPLHVK